ncbi:MAG: serine--tRNA ligase [Myxococcota bacterium]
MLDLKLLEKDPAGVRNRLARRGEVPALAGLLDKLQQRKQLLERVERDRHERNHHSKQGPPQSTGATARTLCGAKRSENFLGQEQAQAPDEIERNREALRGLGRRIKQQEEQLRALQQEIDREVLWLPNVPRDDVPSGADAADNVEVKRMGEPPRFDFSPRDHVELGHITGMLDQQRGAKISGSRFAFLRGHGSRLNRALLQYLAEFHVRQGDQELSPPYLVRSEAMVGTGQLPKFEQDAFAVAGHDLYLVPTAEVPLTNYLAGEILSQDVLPMRLCAYSPCFRAEAGAAGKDTRGLIRLHQFDKVELVRLVTQEQVDVELQAMVDRASNLLTQLGLPHRIMELCDGDLGFAAEKTFDLEVWLPGQNRYCEISSCSSFGQFQARRIGLRYRPCSNVSRSFEEGRSDGTFKQAKGHSPPRSGAKPLFLCTLNGSALPLGRTLAALWENHQQPDGSVKVPDVLKPYFQGPAVIPAVK